MKANEKTHQSAKDRTKATATELFTTEEKAQYEVFRNGNLARETIEDWTRKDLQAIKSFLHIITTDQNVMKALTDALWARYTELHTGSKDPINATDND